MANIGMAYIVMALYSYGRYSYNYIGHNYIGHRMAACSLRVRFAHARVRLAAVAGDFELGRASRRVLREAPCSKEQGLRPTAGRGGQSR